MKLKKLLSVILVLVILISAVPFVLAEVVVDDEGMYHGIEINVPADDVWVGDVISFSCWHGWQAHCADITLLDGDCVKLNGYELEAVMVGTAKVKASCPDGEVEEIFNATKQAYSNNFGGRTR